MIVELAKKIVDKVNGAACKSYKRLLSVFSNKTKMQCKRSRLQGRQVKIKIVDNLFSTHTHIHKTHTKDKKTKRSDHSVKAVEGNSSNRRTKKSGGASNKCQRLQREYVRSIKSLSDTGAQTRSG